MGRVRQLQLSVLYRTVNQDCPIVGVIGPKSHFSNGLRMCTPCCSLHFTQKVDPLKKVSTLMQGRPKRSAGGEALADRIRALLIAVAKKGPS